jgi:hypothetical protein
MDNVVTENAFWCPRCEDAFTSPADSEPCRRGCGELALVIGWFQYDREKDKDERTD